MHTVLINLLRFVFFIFIDYFRNVEHILHTITRTYTQRIFISFECISCVNIHRIESTFYYFCFFLFSFLFSFSSCHFYENNMFRFHLLKSCLLFFPSAITLLGVFSFARMKSVKCITHNLKHTSSLIFFIFICAYYTGLPLDMNL